MRSSIYKISNLVSGKNYIGQTIKKVEERYNGHIISARNGSEQHIHRSMRKNGFENFKIEVIEENITLYSDLNETQNSLDKREIYWINYFNTFNNGYNSNKGGSGTLGMKHSEESKKKMSEKLKGRIRSFEERKAISLRQKGRKHSEETKKKISASSKGKSKSDKHKLNLSKANIGKTLSDETKRKISESNKGKHKMSNEHKKRLSEIHKGSNRSEETRQKMSESKKSKVSYFLTYEIYNEKSKLLYTVKDGLKKFLKEKKLPLALMDTYRKNTKLYSSSSGKKRAETLGYTNFIGWYIIKKGKNNDE